MNTVSAEPKFKIEMIFGYVEIKTFNVVEGNKLVCYSYSIDYDGDGIERSRTEPEAISAIWWES